MPFSSGKIFPSNSNIVFVLPNVKTMKINFEVSAVINASPNQIYDAWLDSGQHSAMTGGKAVVSNTPGESFVAWDGYIEGRNIKLEPGVRILQHWRTSEFDDSDKDSILEVLLEASNDGTLVTIRHLNLPEHGMQYKQGWVDNYFDPMKEYFAKSK
jgi:activator of HSP90 ATPase